MADNSTTKATRQAKKGVSPISGVAPPENRQFGKEGGNPRHNGAWKKEDTARYKLEQMLKLTADDLKNIATDDEAPLFERKLAQCIAQGKWREIEGIMNQVYGQPKQTQETRLEADITGLEITFKDESKSV